MTTRLSTAARNAVTDARAGLTASGSIKIYSGSQPATPDTAASGSLLATFTLDSTPFASASNGTATLSDTPLETTGATNGTAGWYRIAGSGGAAVCDGACGESSGELILSTTSIVSGVQVSIQSGSIGHPV